MLVRLKTKDRCLLRPPVSDTTRQSPNPPKGAADDAAGVQVVRSTVVQRILAGHRLKLHLIYKSQADGRHNIVHRSRYNKLLQVRLPVRHVGLLQGGTRDMDALQDQPMCLYIPNITEMYRRSCRQQLGHKSVAAARKCLTLFKKGDMMPHFCRQCRAIP